MSQGAGRPPPFLLPLSVPACRLSLPLRGGGVALPSRCRLLRAAFASAGVASSSSSGGGEEGGKAACPPPRRRRPCTPRRGSEAPAAAPTPTSPVSGPCLAPLSRSPLSPSAPAPRAAAPRREIFAACSLPARLRAPNEGRAGDGTCRSPPLPSLPGAPTPCARVLATEAGARGQGAAGVLQGKSGRCVARAWRQNWGGGLR